MKLRESIRKYSVGKHGAEYIDYSAPVMVCPECQGTNVREVGDEETGRNGDYLCEDCGCEFDTWIGSELTKVGVIVSKIITVLAVIFIVLTGLSVLGGLVYAGYLRSIYPDGSCPESLKVKATLIAALSPLICGTVSAIAINIREKI